MNPFHLGINGFGDKREINPCVSKLGMEPAEATIQNMVTESECIESTSSC